MDNSNGLLKWTTQLFLKVDNWDPEEQELINTKDKSYAIPQK